MIQEFERTLSAWEGLSVHEFWTLGVCWDARKVLSTAPTDKLWRADRLPSWVAAGAYLADDGLHVLGYYVGTEGASSVGIAVPSGGEIIWVEALARGDSSGGLYREFFSIAEEDPRYRELCDADVLPVVDLYVRHSDGRTSLCVPLKAVDGREGRVIPGEKLRRRFDR